MFALEPIIAAVQRSDTMTFRQAAVLGLLCEDKETVGDIAERLRIAKSAVTRAMDVLVERGLAERRENAQDRRADWMVVTAAGRTWGYRFERAVGSAKQKAA